MICDYKLLLGMESFTRSSQRSTQKKVLIMLPKKSSGLDASLARSVTKFILSRLANCFALQSEKNERLDFFSNGVLSGAVDKSGES